MAKLKIVIGEMVLDASGSEAEVSAAMKSFMATIVAAMQNPANTTVADDEPKNKNPAAGP